jgi:uncharacterized protein YciW
MTDLEPIRNTTALLCTSPPTNSSMDAALLARSDVLIMTQEAENAVLKPLDCGSWPHSLRAALAARIATHNALPKLALHYTQMISDDGYNDVANPSYNGSALNLAHVIAFLDGVTVQPRDINKSDIRRLQDAAVSDADIVKLTELIAFMAYQTRLIVGIELLSRGVA